MEIKFVCEECGKSIPVVGSKLSSQGGYPSVITLKVNHVCDETEKHCTLSEAITEVKGQMVEIAYFKKDGSFTTMRGIFNSSIKSEIGYEFFLKDVTGKGQLQPRSLIRAGISSVYLEATGFTFIIGNAV
jgi:hypothetical protein